MRYVLAIDIGASSGRHMLSHVEDGKLVLEEIYRFDNSQIVKNGHDCWDVDSLFAHVKAGIKACGDAGKAPATIGIDTWGVDFVLLDGNDRPCCDAVAYRDARTKGVDEIVEERVSADELYSRCGIQKMPFNTIYQLVALKRENPEALEKAKRFLMMPEYINFLLTGVKANEYTNATTTSLVNAEMKSWDVELLDSLGLPKDIFGELAMPGTVLGSLSDDVAKEVGFRADVILPATHDTGSAFLAVPAANDESVYISSGTWSLLGVENEKPITTPASKAANFTNEGGAWYRYRYLKNIMGLWMIQSIRRELNGVSYVEGKAAKTEWVLADYEKGRRYSYDDLEKAAKSATGFVGTVDVNDARFLSPESMIGEVLEAADVKPATVGELMQCVYVSLAKCYAKMIGVLESLTGKKYTTINIVGGGSKDAYLNALTALETGLEVWAGPTEGTAIGNVIVQHIVSGEFKDLAEARAAVVRSFDVGKI